MVMAKVAFLTRNWFDEKNKEGALHGGNAVMLGVKAAYEAAKHDFVHLMVPGTYWNEDEAAYPELLDFGASEWFRKHDWSQYDLVLNNEFGFEPLLGMVGVTNRYFLQHIEWEDHPEPGIEFLPLLAKFSERAIAAAPSTLAHIAKHCSDVRYIPYPVDENRFTPEGGIKSWADREYDVVWAGRASPQKDPEQLLRTMKQIGMHVRCVVFASFLHPGMKEELEDYGVEVWVDAPMQQCHDAIANSRLVLSTSCNESYATVLVEGLLSGAEIVYPDRLRLGHLFGWGFKEPTHKLGMVCLDLLKYQPDTDLVDAATRAARARHTFGARGHAGRAFVRLLEV
jgi:glycosyltransferase involved in cell wall biosynthesis